MRNLLKNTLNIFVLIGLSALLFGCEGDGKYREYIYPVPVVDEIYPATGYVGSQIAIIGENFGDRIEPVKIFFGGVEAENIISCKSDRIIVEVPVGAQSGDISLTVWTHTLEAAGEFIVIPTPTISSILSSNPGGEIFAEGGDEVTIIGSAFGNNAADVQVTINGKTAELISVMDNEIRVKTPYDYDSGLVVLTVKGYTIEGTALIDPSTKGDVTNLFLKNSTQPFQRGDTGDGEWGTALYWMKNSTFAGNTLQFPDDKPEGLLTMIGATNAWNGMLYQFATLPVGEYEFIVDVAETLKTSGRYGARFAVAKGEVEFPGMAENSSTRIWEFTDKSNILCDVLVSTSSGTLVSETHTLEIILTETTRVTIGFATMMANNNYVKVSGIRIIRK